MAKSNRTIVLFSRWFPYNKVKEQSFLERELILLNQYFDKVIVVPQQIEGEKYEDLPSEIIVDETLANNLKNISLAIKLRTVLSGAFIKEILKIRFDKRKRKYAIAARVSAIVTSDWLDSFFNGRKDVVLYSFWMDFSTLGFALSKGKNSSFKAVSRCHNFDLYGNQDNGFYVPFQEEMIKNLDGIYPDSFGGEEYIRSHFKTEKCKAAIMGVPPIENRNKPSEDGIVRIVSCAYMIPRKRVSLFARALLELSRKNDTVKINWTHIGAGPEFEEVADVVSNFQSNITGNLLGNLSTEELRNLYVREPFDLFVNTSTKEGTPVSIMEAISHGIPVMATDFGGNREIVLAGAGVLLSSDPTTDEIAEKLSSLVESGNLKKLRAKSLEVWDTGYNSENNYKEFCDRLAKV